MFNGDEDFENKAPVQTTRRKRGRPRKSAQLVASRIKDDNPDIVKDAKVILDVVWNKENAETPPCIKRKRGRPRKSQMCNLIAVKPELESSNDRKQEKEWSFASNCEVTCESPRFVLQNNQSAAPTTSAAGTLSGYSSACTQTTTLSKICTQMRHCEIPTMSRAVKTTIQRDTSDAVDVEDFKRKMIAKWNKTRTYLTEMVRADERLQNEIPKELRLSNTNSTGDLKSSIIDKVYELSRNSELGEGHFGMVFCAVERATQKPVAIKEIRKDRFPNVSERFYARLLRTEVAILQSISHPAIIGLEAVHETTRSIFIVLERMDIDLFTLTARREKFRLSEQFAKFFVAQILHALAYLHQRDIAHCDIKPENVLLTGLNTDYPHAKLCDFGFARFVGQKSQCSNAFGTPVYAAPEIMARESFDKGVDVWAMGVLTFDILAGHLPFPVKERVTEKHVEPRQLFRPHKHWERMEDSAKHFVQKLLQINPDKRPTVAECLAHHWLTDGQLYIDLRLLEKRVGAGRYLTTVADDERFMAECKFLDEYGTTEAEN